MDKFEINIKIFDKYKDIVCREIFSRLEQNFNIPDSLKQSILMILYNRLIFLCDDTVMELRDIEISNINFFYKINKDMVSEEEKKEGADNLHKLLDDRGINFIFEKNSNLEKILDHCVSKFCIFICEFLERIYKDKDVIKDKFFGDESDNSDFQIDWIKSESADLHNDNKTTLIVSTNLGKIIYRPHNMKIDTYFHDFFEKYFNKWAYVPNALDFDTYGYSEFIEASDEDTLDESIYFNIGALSAIFVALGSTDYHVENLLRKGNKPAIIDLETIVSPKQKLDKKKTVGFDNDISNTIYVSAILPKTINNFQISVLFNKLESNKLALKNNGKNISINEYYREKNLNQDLKNLQYETFFNGFDDAYFYILDKKEEIIKYLKNANKLDNRILLRNTDTYGGMLKYTTRSYVAKLNDSYNIILRALKLGLDEANFNDFQNIAKSEAESIINGDVPYFYCNNVDHNLYDGKGNLAKADYFEKTGIENAICHLNNLSKTENDFEKGIFKFSFRNAVEEKTIEEQKKDTAKYAECITKYKDEDKIDLDESIISSLKKDIEDDVIGIHNSLVDNAILSTNGYYGYFSLRDKDLFNERSDYFLGSGYTGVLLFLVSSNKYFANKNIKNIKPFDAIYESLINELSYVIDLYANEYKNIKQAIPIGLINGIGGLYKALSIIYCLNNDKRVYSICLKIINFLNDQFYPKENTMLDMYSGISGLIYSLLSVDEFKEYISKDLIIRLTDFLISKRTFKYKESTLWNTLDKTWAISGYAHGISGICVALNYAHNYLKDEKLNEASIDGLKYEYNIFNESIKTWPDLRGMEVSDNYMHGICSGAPGIGLSMLSYIKYKRNIDNDTNRQYLFGNLDRAINKCIVEMPAYRDILCCGNSSSIEFFTEMLKIINDYNIYNDRKDDIIRALYKLTRFIHERHLKNNEYTIMSQKHYNVYWISLLYGYSGIGYAMLRYLDKDILKSIFV